MDKPSLFKLGVGAMAAALALQTVTLASGDYAAVLLIALGLTAVADACLIAVAWNSGTWLRVISIVFILPTLFIVEDFTRRAPFVYSL
jgi:hypothetical protein